MYMYSVHCTHIKIFSEILSNPKIINVFRYTAVVILTVVFVRYLITMVKV